VQSSVSDNERVEDVISMTMCGEKSICFIFKGYRHSALCFTKYCFEPVFIWLSALEIPRPKESSCYTGECVWWVNWVFMEIYFISLKGNVLSQRITLHNMWQICNQPILRAILHRALLNENPSSATFAKQEVEKKLKSFTGQINGNIRN